MVGSGLSDTRCDRVQTIRAKSRAYFHLKFVIGLSAVCSCHSIKSNVFKCGMRMLSFSFSCNRTRLRLFVFGINHLLTRTPFVLIQGRTMASTTGRRL